MTLTQRIRRDILRLQLASLERAIRRERSLVLIARKAAVQEQLRIELGAVR